MPRPAPPLGEEVLAVLDCLLPAHGRDMVRTALLKHFAGTTNTTKDDRRGFGVPLVVFRRIGRNRKWLPNEVEILAHGCRFAASAWWRGAIQTSAGCPLVLRVSIRARPWPPQRERSPDPVAGPVAAEQVADRRPRHPLGPACWSARAISSAMGSPNRSPKTNAADDSQYSQTARAASRCGTSIWPARRVAHRSMPSARPAPRLGRPRHRAVRPGRLIACYRLRAHWSRAASVMPTRPIIERPRPSPAAARPARMSRSHRASHQTATPSTAGPGKEEPVREPVRRLSAGEAGAQLIDGDVADDRDVRSGGAQR